MENPKILVVDDDPDIVETMRIVLEANSYQVFTAGSGAECLNKIKEVDPDLIILDVMMDTLTDGFQVSYQLRNPDPNSEYAKYAKIPILMVTGIGEKTKMKFSPQTDGDYLPVDDFVEKPIQSQVLLEKVRKLLKNN
ncbi:response regulator [Candidatus Bathyarchaeota archaeon]|nr:MAG: response regulator [Candidatus Bathyarchaeota archaeon]